jgi:hypothetical protein
VTKPYAGGKPRLAGVAENGTGTRLVSGTTRGQVPRHRLRESVSEASPGQGHSGHMDWYNLMGLQSLRLASLPLSSRLRTRPEKPVRLVRLQTRAPRQVDVVLQNLVVMGTARRTFAPPHAGFVHGL